MNAQSLKSASGIWFSSPVVETFIVVSYRSVRTDACSGSFSADSNRRLQIGARCGDNTELRSPRQRRCGSDTDYKKRTATTELRSRRPAWGRARFTNVSMSRSLSSRSAHGCIDVPSRSNVRRQVSGFAFVAAPSQPRAGTHGQSAGPSPTTCPQGVSPAQVDP